MPTLYHWFEQQYERLTRESKHELVNGFEAYRQAFFDYDYGAVLSMLPRLYDLTEAFHEPTIRQAVDYYYMIAKTYWQGDLTAGLDIIHRAALQAQAKPGAGSVLELYLRLKLLYAWLDTDGPGYAHDVIQAVEESPNSLPPDLALRLDVLRMYALLSSSDVKQARDLLAETLPKLGPDWLPPFRHSMMADLHVESHEYHDALYHYRHARQGFEQMNHTILSTAMQIGIGGALIEMEEYEAAQQALREALSAAERSLNRAHVGFALGQMGKALGMAGDHQAGIDYLNRALETLDGLGWQREEAEYALTRLRFAKYAGVAIPLEQWDRWKQDAHRRVMALRSTDLRGALSEISDE